MHKRYILKIIMFGFILTVSSCDVDDLNNEGETLSIIGPFALQDNVQAIIIINIHKVNDLFIFDPIVNYLPDDWILLDAQKKSLHPGQSTVIEIKTNGVCNLRDEDSQEIEKQRKSSDCKEFSSQINYQLNRQPCGGIIIQSSDENCAVVRVFH